MSGDLYSWGRGEDGVLGFPDAPECQFTPRLVDELREFFEIIVCGDDHCLAKGCTCDSKRVA